MEFYNVQLILDLNKLISSDNITILMDINPDLVFPYVIEVNNETYFYESSTTWERDYNLLCELFNI